MIFPAVLFFPLHKGHWDSGLYCDSALYLSVVIDLHLLQYKFTTMPVCVKPVDVAREIS